MNDQIYVKTLEIAGFASALKAVRLPMKNGEKSDSYIEQKFTHLSYENNYYDTYCCGASVEMGLNDMKLLQKLIRSGDEHGKVTRGIHVWFEVNMPRYIHAELDTYKIGAERLSSESTMHCECKNFNGEELQAAKGEIKESLLQKRIWDMSYQTLRRMYFQRRNHRLPEWKEIICPWIETLPLSKELITINSWYIDKIEELKNKIKELEGVNKQ
jgi:hypothetical protein